MALSTAYGFHYRRNLRPGQKPAVLEVILADSAVVAIGEGVLYSSGYLAAGAADKALLGILVGIVTEKGENVFKTNEAHGGTISGDDTFTAASGNSTSQKVKGVVIVDGDALFEVKVDESIAQAEVGLWFDGLANTNTGVDGITGTGAAWAVGTQQWQLIDLVTEDLSGTAVTDRGLVRLGRSQLLNDVTI